MDWSSKEGRRKLHEAYSGLPLATGVTTLGGWMKIDSTYWFHRPTQALYQTWLDSVVQAEAKGDLLPAPNHRYPPTWEWMKARLARELEWPFAYNLTWWPVWPGGWCLHARNPDASGPEQQKSATFDLGFTDPVEALVEATLRVRDKKKPGRVRWFCDEHNWEVVRDRGVMQHGCPECGGYKCEDVTD